MHDISLVHAVAELVVPNAATQGHSSPLQLKRARFHSIVLSSRVCGCRSLLPVSATPFHVDGTVHARHGPCVHSAVSCSAIHRTERPVTGRCTVRTVNSQLIT